MARLGPVSPEAAPFHNPDQLALLADRELGVDRPGEWPSDETQLEDLGFVALDCETTGHFPHRMVELGAVRFQLGAPGRPSQPRLSLESLVHTEDHINPYARRVHGIHASMLSGAPTLRRVATAFDELARGTVLVEHSADGFDTRLVSRALGRPLPHHHLDTSRIAGFLFELRDTIGLERLCEQLGVTHRSPHFALADSEATADCFVKLVQIGQERFGWRNLGDLLAVGMPPIPRLAPKPRPRRAVAAAPAPAAERAAGGAVAGGPERPARRRRRGGRGRRRKSTADSADQPSSDLSQPAVQ
ncbi:MAG: 3'-5' exonuclease [Candidatus Dormibacteria bacterium]